MHSSCGCRHHTQFLLHIGGTRVRRPFVQQPRPSLWSRLLAQSARYCHGDYRSVGVSGSCRGGAICCVSPVTGTGVALLMGMCLVLFSLFAVAWDILGMVLLARASDCHQHAPELWNWAFAAMLISSVSLPAVSGLAGVKPKE